MKGIEQTYVRVYLMVSHWKSNSMQYADVWYVLVAKSKAEICAERPVLVSPFLSSASHFFFFSPQDGTAFWRLRQGFQVADLRTPSYQHDHRGAGASAQPAGRHPLASLVQPHAHRLDLQWGQLAHPHGPGQHPLRRRDGWPVNTHAHSSRFTVHVAWNTHTSKYVHWNL